MFLGRMILKDCLFFQSSFKPPHKCHISRVHQLFFYPSSPPKQTKNWEIKLPFAIESVITFLSIFVLFQCILIVLLFPILDWSPSIQFKNIYQYIHIYIDFSFKVLVKKKPTMTIKWCMKIKISVYLHFP